MKIVCVNNIELSKDSYGKPRHKRLPLTIGKTYEAEPDGIFVLDKVNFYTLVKDNEEDYNIEGYEENNEITNTNYFHNKLRQ